MVTAMWNGVVVAESDDTEVVEGSHYFPPDSVNREYFSENDLSTNCWWKGAASYYDLVVDGKTNPSAAWTYLTPLEKAESIRGYVAFYGSVDVRG